MPCAATPETQLQGWCAVAGTPTEKTCGAYRLISETCFETSVGCVYDGQGKLVAWRRCEGQPGDRPGWPADCAGCLRGGDHAPGERSPFFAGETTACGWAPPAR